ncbi:hypothetical protein E1181_08915 [Saccharopolyspora terrae]|uniref:Uncharacterized protein n=1 Tax=Saccharopolyspora terrae TaxID=2530384 RepID=A0A4R4VNY6_9PSEU|nr:hypothetical protein E1181_08915 [Saccharopolyspora terrae]
MRPVGYRDRSRARRIDHRVATHATSRHPACNAAGRVVSTMPWRIVDCWRMTRHSDLDDRQVPAVLQPAREGRPRRGHAQRRIPHHETETRGAGHPRHAQRRQQLDPGHRRRGRRHLRAPAPRRSQPWARR